MSLFNELKRRNVFRVAAGYIVLAWLVIQVAETILPFYGVPDEAIRLLITVLAVLFIPVVILAWVFEWTPEGIKVDEGAEPRGPRVAAAAKRWDRVVMLILALAVTFFVVEKILDEEAAIEPAIAVLPFESLSVDAQHQYFSVGVPENVHGLLARIPTLTVSAWSTAFDLRTQGLPAAEIAATLKVPNLLEGTVQTSGDRIRVTARLVAVASSTTLWSQTYEKTFDDVFAIQDEIAADVVANLRVELLGEMPTSQRTNAETQRLTTQAWSLLHAELGSSGEKSAAAAALELLEQALELDPDYVQALLAKNFAEYNLMLEGAMTGRELAIAWQDTKIRVLEIDPEDGLFNAYLAWDSVFEYQDFVLANQQLQLALRHGLNNLEALRALESIARRTGNPDAAIALGRRSQAIDPTCTRCLWQYTESLFYAGKYREAIEAKKRLRLMAQNAGGLFNHANSLILLGDYEAAIELAEANTEWRDGSQGAAVVAMASWSLGDDATFQENLKKLTQSETQYATGLAAQVYAWAGKSDLAFEWIERAIDAGEDLRPNLLLPVWDNLRDDTRWDVLRERLDWTDAQLSVLDFSAISPRS
mgnify:CR=1 FL=1